MEEKKDNKGLIIGLIIFLVLCLIGVIYFIFNMVSVDTKDSSSSSTNQTESNNVVENEDTTFTMLDKYELNDGEEKEIEVEGNKIIIKKSNGQYYINEKALNSTTGIYITNKLIISYVGGQFGLVYEFYDFNLNKLNTVNFNGYRNFTELQLDSGKILTNASYNPTEWAEGQVIGNLITEPCEISSNKSKKLNEYQDVIKEHENDVIFGIYEIKYEDNTIKLELYEAKQTVKQYLENTDLNNICAVERGN